MSKLAIELSENNYRFAFAPLRRLSELKYGIEELHRGGQLDERLHRGRLSEFVYDPPPDFPGARSVIVIALPHAKVRVSLEWKGATRRLIMPPTYLWHLDERDERRLAGIFASRGFRVAKAVLPVKALAARSGLGAYGRNNVVYIPGRGSYHRLVAFFTDAPCEDDRWAAALMLNRCERCTSCLDSCPTGAIQADRFLLRAERCLTYLNEEKDDFPEWLNPRAHHCIVGCMACQAVCPENRRVRDWTEDVGHFSESETVLIMRRTPLSELPTRAVEELARLDIVEYYNVLPRNLGVLFDKEAGA